MLRFIVPRMLPSRTRIVQRLHGICERYLRLESDFDEVDRQHQLLLDYAKSGKDREGREAASEPYRGIGGAYTSSNGEMDASKKPDFKRHAEYQLNHQKNVPQSHR